MREILLSLILVGCSARGEPDDGGADCGNGAVEEGEACDDGNDEDDDDCPTSCQPARCGDGFVQAGVEPCDDGNDDETDDCTADCVSTSCGDGLVQEDLEQCDDGNGLDTDSCTSACEPARCGDGFVQTGVEDCDDGNEIPTDACTGCRLATCGDGVIQIGVEACDDGNPSDTDACTKECEEARCGDGFVQAGEQCDDENAIDTDDCLTACLDASCGDGVVQAGVEECDDGNDDETDDCLSTCEPTCEPGLLNCGGVCFDGDSDPEHCGGCEVVCGACSSCVAGECQPYVLEGPYDAAVGETLDDVGSRSWEDAGNVTSEDGSEDWGARDGTAYISAMVDHEVSNYLVGRDFGLAVPDGARIVGILAEIRGRSLSGVGIEDAEVRTILGDVVGASNEAGAATWSDAWVTRRYGDDQGWVEGYTTTDVNSPDFGIALSVFYDNFAGNDWVMVDVIRAGVYYECP